MNEIRLGVIGCGSHVLALELAHVVEAIVRSAEEHVPVQVTRG